LTLINLEELILHSSRKKIKGPKREEKKSTRGGERAVAKRKTTCSNCALRDYRTQKLTELDKRRWRRLGSKQLFEPELASKPIGKKGGGVKRKKRKCPGFSQ